MHSFFLKPPAVSNPIDVAVAGATGVVGQKLLALSHYTPWIRVVEVAASAERTDQYFGEVCSWRDESPLPEFISGLRCSDMNSISAPYILSCLPSEIAEIYEPEWIKKGHHVFSNASFFRMHPHVPLLIPEINAAHLAVLEHQKTPGKMITNPNCSATGIALALAPILSYFTPKHISIVTLQSLSGAGHPGVASLDILGNTIPHIAGESKKIEQELKKILGSVHELGSVHTPVNFPISVNVHRVPVLYGHVATLHIMLQEPVSGLVCKDIYQEWNRALDQELFVCHTLPERPQVRLDLSVNDMRIHMGPIETGADGTVLRLNILSHNLVRGAAGAVFANLKSFVETFDC